MGINALFLQRWLLPICSPLVLNLNLDLSSGSIEPGFDLLRRSFRISALGSPLLEGDGVRLQQLGHDQCLDNAF